MSRTVPSHYSSQLSRCRARQGRLLYVDDPCADPNLAGELCDQLFASHALLLSLAESGLIAFAHVIWSLPKNSRSRRQVPLGIDGSRVEEMVLAGQIEEVARYCETDVVNTYRVWLVYELFRGSMAV